MITCAQPVRASKPATRTAVRSILFVVLAVCLPVLAGLAWHRASDNPAWPLLRTSLNLCELRNAPLSPLSPDELYRAHVVQATCFGRFSETLVFVTDATDPWSLAAADPNRAILEAAGLRSLDAVNWSDSSTSGAPVLQLWFVPGASPTQIHRIDPAWRSVIIKPLTSSPAPGAERFAY